MAKRKDVYPQFMKLEVTQSAADTLTFGQVSLGVALFEYAGILIQRIEYHINAGGLALMTAESDIIEVAITGSDTISDLDVKRPQVYDRVAIFNATFGAAVASAGLVKTPIVSDYSLFPGGGTLVPAQDIYIGLDSGGLASATAVGARLWYTIEELGSEDYFELVQRLRVLGT